MNKIFRIVWSQATQSWVVVSELTKAHKNKVHPMHKKVRSNSQAILLNLQPSHWHY